MKIYFWDISEEYEEETILNEGRNDIVVQIGEDYYCQVKCWEINTFSFRCKYDIEHYGFYDRDPMLIIVKEASKQCIIETIKKLKDRGFFRKLNPLTFQEVKEFYKPIYDAFTPDLSFCDDWHVVYDDGGD